MKMTFGKYRGQEIEDVADENFGYLSFMILKSDWQPNGEHGRCLEEIRLLYTERAISEAREKAEVQAAQDEMRADFPVTDKRTKVIGTIRTVKYQASDFGGSYKMLVEADQGFKVWTSVPSSLPFDAQYYAENQSAAPESLVGKRVEFEAKLQPSPKDSKFGFGSRPTKAKLLAA